MNMHQEYSHLFGGKPLLLKTFILQFRTARFLRHNPLLFETLLFCDPSFLSSNPFPLKPSLLLCLLLGGDAFLLEPFLLPKVLLSGPGQLGALGLFGVDEALPLGAQDAILLFLVQPLLLPLELGLLGCGGQPFGEAGGLLAELVRGLPGGGRQTFGQPGLLDGLPLLFGQGSLLEIETGGGLPLLLGPLLFLQLLPGGLDVGLVLN